MWNVQLTCLPPYRPRRAAFTSPILAHARDIEGLGNLQSREALLVYMYGCELFLKMC
jgi:hypothetical protein